MHVIILALPIAFGQAADVRLNDGSLVRLTLTTPEIAVRTKYGVLTIPLAEVRRVDVGLHLPGGVAAKLESAGRSLGSTAFRERDEAAKLLESLGDCAIPTLARLARSQDLEVSARASAVLTALRAKGVEGRKEDDVILAREFTVIGRVQSGGIKARSAVFGDVSLSLSDLRTIHVAATFSREFTVNAEKDEWLDTEAFIEGGVRLHVQAEGQVDLWPIGPGQYMVSPKGFSTTGRGGNFMAGALIGRVGESGKAFFIGESHNARPEGEGNLFLQIVPSVWNNASSGSYRVRRHAEPGQPAGGLLRVPEPSGGTQGVQVSRVFQTNGERERMIDNPALRDQSFESRRCGACGMVRPLSNPWFAQPEGWSYQLIRSGFDPIHQWRCPKCLKGEFGPPTLQVVWEE